MKFIKTIFLTLVIYCNTSAQNTSSETLALSTNFLDEVVVTDSRFILKRSQSGKTVVKINSKEIQQFSALGLGILLSTHLGIDVIGKTLILTKPNLVYPWSRNRQVLISLMAVSDPSRIDTIYINLLNIEMIELFRLLKELQVHYTEALLRQVVNVIGRRIHC